MNLGRALHRSVLIVALLAAIVSVANAAVIRDYHDAGSGCNALYLKLWNWDGTTWWVRIWQRCPDETR